jgi:hypothetical protein
VDTVVPPRLGPVPDRQLGRETVSRNRGPA